MGISEVAGIGSASVIHHTAVNVVMPIVAHIVKLKLKLTAMSTEITAKAGANNNNLMFEVDSVFIYLSRCFLSGIVYSLIVVANDWKGNNNGRRSLYDYA